MGRRFHDCIATAAPGKFIADGAFHSSLDGGLIIFITEHKRQLHKNMALNCDVILVTKSFPLTSWMPWLVLCWLGLFFYEQDEK